MNQDQPEQPVRKSASANEPSQRYLDWACVRPALVKRVSENPDHPVVLGEMWPEELRPSTISLVCGPYEEHELLVV